MMPDSWKLLPVLSAPMPFQMALDEILLRDLQKCRADNGVAVPMMRFYYASEPWVSLGYSSKELEGDEKASLSGFPLCRRITGGGWVLHGKDLMFSIISEKYAHAAFGSVKTSYVKIHEAVKRALEELGHQPCFYSCRENLPSGRNCFVFPIASDLSLGGKKIAGGGQKRSAGLMLHQESLQLRCGIDGEELIPALTQAFESTFLIRFEAGVLDPDWLEQAESLGQAQYLIQSFQDR